MLSRQQCDAAIRYTSEYRTKNEIMAYFSIVDKQSIEKVFGMGSGYVLNFSDRTFG